MVSERDVEFIDVSLVQTTFPTMGFTSEDMESWLYSLYHAILYKGIEQCRSIPRRAPLSGLSSPATLVSVCLSGKWFLCVKCSPSGLAMTDFSVLHTSA